MRIDYLKINGFGKLVNREIEFNKNINLVFGKNETGKSTLLKCIMAMFYGLSRNKNGKDVSDMEKYTPWGNSDFSGKIKYTLDSGKTIEVFREFTKKNPQIFDENSKDISKTFNIDKNKGNEFFYEQTRIDEEMFMATALVEQQRVVLDDKEKSNLTQKISNLLTSGNENISYKKAIEKLNKDLIENIGTDRTVGRPINIVQDRIEKIKEKQKRLNYKEERKNEIQNEKIDIKKNIDQYQEKLTILKNIKAIKEKENIEQAKINVKETIVQDYENKIDNLKFKKPNKNGKITFEIILFAIMIIASITLFAFRKYIFATCAIAIGILNLIYFFFKSEKIKQSDLEFQKEHEILEEAKREKTDEILKERDELNSNINREISEELKNATFIEKNETERILKKGLESLNNKISEIEDNLSKLKIELNTIEIEDENISKELEQKIELEEELKEAKQEEENLLNEANRIKLAKEFLEKAYNKMKSEITPKLTKTLSEIARNISGGKYSNVKLNDEQGLLVELENGEYINSNRLSIGTIDQLYLSLRLSAFREITNESIPIILDESFAYYDSERLMNILKYLNDNFKENQIIIFTCTNREQELLDDLEIKYKFITL